MTRRQHAAVIGAVVAAAIAVYAGAVDGAFIFDDLPHIVHNPALRQVGDFGAALDSEYQETRPVYLASVAVSYWISGPDPAAFRIVNIALHAVCVALVYALGLLMTPADDRRLRWFPAIAALVFAVHPLATEGVTYINSRSGLLIAAFGMGAIVALARGWRWLAVALMVMAAGCKESAVVVPVLAGLYLALFRGRGAVREVWPLLLPVVIVPVLFLLRDNPHEGTIGAGTLPLVHQWLTQPRVLVLFLLLAVAPVRQNIDYDFRVSTGLELEVIGAVAVLVGLAYGAWRWRRRAPIASFGLAWFFVAIAPTNSVVPFKDFIAERHLYLPLVGLALIGGWAAALAIARRRVAVAAVAVYAVALAALTVARNEVLGDPLALWTETVVSSPNKARPHVNLGILLLQRGEPTEGYFHLARAVELDPSDAAAQYNLGVYFEHAGERERAVDHLRQAVALRPARSYRRSFAHNAGALAVAHYEAGAPADAETLLAEAVAADPDAATLRYNHAVVLLALGRPTEARAELEATLRLDPTHEKARARLADL